MRDSDRDRDRERHGEGEEEGEEERRGGGENKPRRSDPVDLDVARTSLSQVCCLAFTKRSAILRHTFRIHPEDRTHTE